MMYTVGCEAEADEFDRYVKCGIRELEEVLMRDVGNRIGGCRDVLSSVRAVRVVGAVVSL